MIFFIVLFLNAHRLILYWNRLWNKHTHKKKTKKKKETIIWWLFSGWPQRTRLHSMHACMQQFLFPVLIIFSPKRELCTILRIAIEYADSVRLKYRFIVVKCIFQTLFSERDRDRESERIMIAFALSRKTTLWLRCTQWKCIHWNRCQHIISSSKTQMKYPFNLHSLCGYWQQNIC